MKRLFIVIMTLSAAWIWMSPKPDTFPMKETLSGPVPSDWFMSQRVYPRWEINYEAHRDAMEQAAQMKTAVRASEHNLPWTFAGPINIGGRITDIEMHPTDLTTIYAAAASGGVFKSTNGGVVWDPVFDEALSLSIGDMALDPTNPQTVYVGTGEANCGGGSLAYEGYGMYRSADGGGSWLHLGLEETRNIGRVIVDPADPQRVFVAAMGKLFGVNPERGLYRSTDAGDNWENVLYVSDSTGCIDVIQNPVSPDTIYAAMWERIRRPWGRQYGGVTCGLYRSTDGGDTWSPMTNGLPDPAGGGVGRIGVSLCASNPSIVYAIYADDIGFFSGVFKSTDAGNSWTQTNDAALGSLYSSYGWWFGNIRVNPVDPDEVYVMGLDVYKTTNGGSTWANSSGGMHVDQHGMYIHPQNSDFVVAGNDGGVYVSQNAGASWAHVQTMPITQFYTCEVDNQFPHRLYGGTQDNFTIRTTTGNLNDWHDLLGGDGFYVLVDPEDNDYVYAEYQYGNIHRSTDGGNSFVPAMAGISSGDRKNWNTPIVFNPSNPETLYTGTHRVYWSVNRAASWHAISPDLSNGPSPGNLVFGTVTTITVAPSDPNIIYAGTDDGNVQVTLNGGTNWTQIDAGLPDRWVTRVAVDPNDGMIAYATFSGYRWDEYLSHVFRTTDGGSSWQDIAGNLPAAPVNDIIVDPDLDSTLYVGSDVGVYVTNNLGSSWAYLGDPLPNVPVTDLVLHRGTRKLVAATYGRSMYTYDLGGVTSVSQATRVPGRLILAQNYPNPFNPSTTIAFTIPESGFVTLKLFNLLGQEIATLASQKMAAGKHHVQWNAQGVSSGTYVYVLTAGNHSESRKLVLLK